MEAAPYVADHHRPFVWCAMVPRARHTYAAVRPLLCTLKGKGVRQASLGWADSTSQPPPPSLS